MNKFQGYLKMISVTWRMLSVMILLSTVGIVTAQATSPPASEQYGLFLHKEKTAEYYRAPTLRTEVQLTIHGLVMRATVRQHFFNPSGEWLEGIYVFPLPEDAAVDHLRMQIGDRLVQGEIQEKEEAKKSYQQAKQQGKRAGLVTSARENVFKTSVANIGAGEEVIIEIQYGDAVGYRDGRFGVRFPMVVAPRYIPGHVTRQADGTPGTTQVPDAFELLAPVRDPQTGTVNPLGLTVNLHANTAKEHIQSLYHPVKINEPTPHHYQLTLAQGVTPANRDFVLEWTPGEVTATRASLYTEQVHNDTYLYGTIFPPTVPLATQEIPKRNILLVVDVSSSMAGTSMRQVKGALKVFASWLRPTDRFNLLTFDDHTTALFEGFMPGSNENLSLARRFITRMETGGGTNILQAIKQALAHATDPERFTQVLILTDGGVGNEHEVFQTIAARLGKKRLFTVGIGSAPNSHFMQEAASLGRGTFTYIGSVEEVATRMLSLFRKMESPAVTDINVAWRLQPSGDNLLNAADSTHVTFPISITMIRLPLPQDSRINVPPTYRVSWN